jgi:hypothetical protein
MEKTHRIIDVLDNLLISDNGLVAEDALDKVALQYVLDDCFLIIADKDSFKFSFLGKNIIEAVGDKFFSEDVSDLVLPTKLDIAEALKKVIKTKKPLENSGEIYNQNGVKIKYRRKIYPLTDKEGGKEVKYIFGGMRWKKEF